MMLYPFPAFIVIDTSGGRAPNAVGSVYSPDDTAFATPLEVFDLGGISLGTNLTANDEAFVGQFQVDGYPRVMYKSGPYVIEMFSAEGIIEDVRSGTAAAQTAQLAAQLAATAALAAQAAAEDAASGSGGSGGGSGVGNLVIIVWDGVGTQPGRVYPVGHDLAGGTIPLPPEAYVRWRQPTFPTGVAVDGDEYRRLG